MTLSACLLHARAMELAFAVTLAGPTTLDRVLLIRRDTERHHADCQRHARLLAARLRAHGAAADHVPDPVLGAWLDMIVTARDPLWTVRSLLDAQSVKVRTYDILEHVADADGASTGLARHCRDEEESRRRRIARVWSRAVLSLPPVVASARDAS